MLHCIVTIATFTLSVCLQEKGFIYVPVQVIEEIFRKFKKKIKFLLYSSWYQLGVASWHSLSLQHAPGHTVQGCFGGKAMATSVNLTNSGLNLVSLVKRLKHLPFDHLGDLLESVVMKNFNFYGLS